MNLRSIYFLSALCLAILNVGCKDKTAESDIYVQVNFRYNSQPLVYDQEYDFETDKKIKIELVKFYVSKPALQNEKGDWIASPTEYFLVQLDQPEMNFGKMPMGNYSALRFGIGVDNSRNIETDPNAIPSTDYPTDHPLNFASDMYWGWSSGYIFAKIEGRIDVDNNGSYSDLDDKAISYHPGVSDLYRSVVIQKTINVDSETEQAEITLDLNTLFMGVKFVQHPVAHPNGIDSPEYNYAKRMMDNFPVSFE